MRVLLVKLKEVLFSVLPITALVTILHFTATPLPVPLFIRFWIGAVFVTVGLSIFLFGIDIGISPLGTHIGASLSKSNRLLIVAVVGLVLGFFISVAEPDLQILAAQVASVTRGQLGSTLILLVVSLGIGAMLVAGLIRIVYNFPLYKLLAGLYGLILLLSLFVSPEVLAVSFDASGATTGALTVPFILALALGVSALKKDSKASEKDSFGLVAVTSCGAILGVLIMGLVTGVSGLTGTLPHGNIDRVSVLAPFVRTLPEIAAQSSLAVAPLLLIYLAFQIKVFRFQTRQFTKGLKGLLYTLIGLILFLTGVHVGFMDVGTVIGYEIALFDNNLFPVAIGCLLGLITVLAEPAVHVLTDQIETVTSGYVKRTLVRLVLAVGVALAVGLSILRIIIPAIQLWHYLLPGYILSVALSFFVPKLYVGIAFDSGGVASGPMTATFILAFAQGVAESIPGADVLKDAFGMIALVAMTPIITLQILGLIVKVKSKKRQVNEHA